MDFKSAAELLKLCEEENLPISQVMRRREMSETGAALPDIDRRMARAWEIMTESAKTPLTTPGKSMGGLIGGEAKKLADHQAAGKGLCGDVLGAAMTYQGLCQLAGIPCQIVSGTREGKGRYWNIVELGGVFRHVDVYAQLPEEEFLRTDSQMEEYNWDTGAYPACAD